MSWDKQTSLDRIRRRWDARDTEITVSKLARDMDLENVTLHKGRLIYGAHLYATVAGSGHLDRLDTDEGACSALQRIALWQGEVSKMAEAFDVPIIAFQGARVHLLVFRPIDDDQAIVRKAALLGRAISLMTLKAFNPLFDEDLRLIARAAADVGETVATRGGTRGDSELLFLGNAANRPAKLLGTSKLVVTGRFLDALGDQLDYSTVEAGDDNAYIIKLSGDTVEMAVADDGIDWSVKTSADRLAQELEKWPAERFKISGATELIDPKSLSRSNSKFITATVLIVDIDGFSAYIDEAETDSVKRDAILTLDAVRQEMRAVLKADYNGVRIQYQGDNMVAVVHLPADDDEKIAIAAAKIAAGMQASMDITLPQIVPDAGRLDAVVGVALADTIVSALGQYGRRNALAIGPAATHAENIQMRLDAEQTGIDKATYDALPDTYQTLYDWDASAKAYVADELTAPKLDRVTESLSSDGSRTVTPADKPGLFNIGAAAAGAAEERERVRSFRPYSES